MYDKTPRTRLIAKLWGRQKEWLLTQRIRLRRLLDIHLREPSRHKCLTRIRGKQAAITKSPVRTTGRSWRRNWPAPTAQVIGSPRRTLSQRANTAQRRGSWRTWRRTWTLHTWWAAVRDLCRDWINSEREVTLRTSGEGILSRGCGCVGLWCQQPRAGKVGSAYTYLLTSLSCSSLPQYRVFA